MYSKLLGRSYHAGLDITLPIGYPVIAAADGYVKYVVSGTFLPSGKVNSNGNWVSVIHGPYWSRYAHLDRVAPGLKQGDSIKRGDLIGYSGDTGRTNNTKL